MAVVFKILGAQEPVQGANLVLWAIFRDRDCEPNKPRNLMCHGRSTF